MIALQAAKNIQQPDTGGIAQFLMDNHIVSAPALSDGYGPCHIITSSGWRIDTWKMVPLSRCNPFCGQTRTSPPTHRLVHNQFTRRWHIWPDYSQRSPYFSKN